MVLSLSFDILMAPVDIESKLQDITTVVDQQSVFVSIQQSFADIIKKLTNMNLSLARLATSTSLDEQTESELTIPAVAATEEASDDDVCLDDISSAKMFVTRSEKEPTSDVLDETVLIKDHATLVPNPVSEFSEYAGSKPSTVSNTLEVPTEVHQTPSSFPVLHNDSEYICVEGICDETDFTASYDGLYSAINFRTLAVCQNACEITLFDDLSYQLLPIWDMVWALQSVLIKLVWLEKPPPFPPDINRSVILSHGINPLEMFGKLCYWSPARILSIIIAMKRVYCSKLGDGEMPASFKVLLVEVRKMDSVVGVKYSVESGIGCFTRYHFLALSSIQLNDSWCANTFMSESKKLFFYCPAAKPMDMFLSEVNSNMATRFSSICDYWVEATSQGLALSLNTTLKPIYALVFGQHPLEMDSGSAKLIIPVELNCEHHLHLWETIMFTITWPKKPPPLPPEVDANLSNYEQYAELFIEAEIMVSNVAEKYVSHYSNLLPYHESTTPNSGVIIRNKVISDFMKRYNCVGVHINEAKWDVSYSGMLRVSFESWSSFLNTIHVSSSGMVLNKKLRYLLSAGEHEPGRGNTGEHCYWCSTSTVEYTEIIRYLHDMEKQDRVMQFEAWGLLGLVESHFIRRLEKLMIIKLPTDDKNEQFGVFAPFHLIFQNTNAMDRRPKVVTCELEVIMKITVPLWFFVGPMVLEIDEFIWFSLPRPPEFVNLEDKVDF